MLAQAGGGWVGEDEMARGRRKRGGPRVWRQFTLMLNCFQGHGAAFKINCRARETCAGAGELVK
jgi:hypothetical protein